MDDTPLPADLEDQMLAYLDVGAAALRPCHRGRLRAWTARRARGRRDRLRCALPRRDTQANRGNFRVQPGHEVSDGPPTPASTKRRSGWPCRTDERGGDLADALASRRRVLRRCPSPAAARARHVWRRRHPVGRAGGLARRRRSNRRGGRVSRRHGSRRARRNAPRHGGARRQRRWRLAVRSSETDPLSSRRISEGCSPRSCL